MIHLLGPFVLAAVLVGIGLAGVLLRRNAVLVLIGVELILAGALVLAVSVSIARPADQAASSVLPLFVMTIAAAEVVLALAVILAVYRLRGSIDVDRPSEDTP